jgi:hypothetical protein
MRTIILWPVAAFLAALTLLPLAAEDLTPDQEQQIITRFAAKEAEFSRARENYTYRQTYRLETLDGNGRPDGRFERVFDIVFDNEGKRSEHVVYAPMDTLQRILMDPQDEQDMHSTQQFVLTTKDLPNYELHYIGRQNIDEISCYVFAVRPRHPQEGQRFFAGQIWVDDKDLQIVKTYGRGVGAQKRGSNHRYPKFETYREQIDGKYWFPTYTVANDILDFKDERVGIKMVVTYKDYKQFKSSSTITFGDVDESKPEKK